jgi:hypothetical protein
VMITGTDTSNTMTIVVSQQPGKTFRGSIYYSFTYSFYIGGNDFYSSTYTTPPLLPVSLTNYDFGTLNATAMADGSVGNYVSTDHGIFVTASGLTRLEYQPSSNFFAFNDIYFLNASSPNGYACGNNGLLMVTTDGGGATKPYCSFTSNGGCKGATVGFIGTPGTGTTCAWYVNTTQFSTSCTSATYPFPNTGTYNISYVVTNAAGNADTCLRVINIVDTPLVNMSFSVTDPILCKSQPLQLTIQNTQLNVNYLLKYSGTVYGTGAGNGGTLSFYSDTGLFSHTYTLTAMSSLATACLRNFTTTIPVTVEKTQSLMHHGLINAEPNEPMSFNATSIDAQNYSWTFNPNANIASSTLKSPPNVSFGTAGPTSVRLISWSNNGCYDTLTTTGPFIYNEPAIDDTCWVFNEDANDAPWMGYYVPDLNYSKPSANGFFIVGTAKEDSLKSRYGVGRVRTKGGGGYVAKYSFNGALKWAITSIDSAYDNQSSNKTTISAIAEDHQGNIYIAGPTIPNDKFTDNNGDTIPLSQTPLLSNSYHRGFIAKFDSTGKFIWSHHLYDAYPVKLMVDNDNNVILAGNYFFGLIYYANGIKDTLVPYLNSDNQIAKSFLLKTDTAGNKIWNILHMDNTWNAGGFRDFSLDAANNIYMAGCFEGWCAFYNANTWSNAVDSFTVYANQAYMKSYVAKYNAAGVFQWRNVACHYGYVESVYNYCLATDKDGNSYMGGSHHGYMPGSLLRIINAAGDTVAKPIGSYFVTKTDKDGKNVWVVGNDASDFGYGYSLYADSSEVVVMGKIYENPTPYTWTGQMMSSDGSGQAFSLGNSDYFFASYDTAGIIKRLTKTGYNENIVIDEQSECLFKDKNGNLYFTGNISFYNGAPYVHYFADSLRTNGRDGIIGKMGKVPCNLYTGLPGDKAEEAEDFTIYPNPTQSDFTVSLNHFTGRGKIEVFNIVGEKVHEQTFENSTIAKIHLPGLSPGMYIVKLQAGKTHLAKKLIISAD